MGDIDKMSSMWTLDSALKHIRESLVYEGTYLSVTGLTFQAWMFVVDHARTAEARGRAAGLERAIEFLEDEAEEYLHGEGDEDGAAMLKVAADLLRDELRAAAERVDGGGA